MAIRTAASLKTKFETGDKPTQTDFEDLFDTLVALPTSRASGDPLAIVAVSGIDPSVISVGTVGAEIITATTTASAAGHLGLPTAIASAGAFGLTFVPVATTAAALAHLDLDASLENLSFSAVGLAIATAANTAAVLNIIGNPASPSSQNQWTAVQRYAETTATIGGTYEWDVAAKPVLKAVLVSNATFSATGIQAGAFYALTLVQGSAGSETGSWSSHFNFAGGTAPTLTTTAGAQDKLTFWGDGTELHNMGQRLDSK